MFVEEYVVDSLREKGLVRRVDLIMPVVAEKDSVIKNWLLEAFHYFLPKDVVQILKNYNDKWKYCFNIDIKFDSKGNILYFFVYGFGRDMRSIDGESDKLHFGQSAADNVPFCQSIQIFG